jgi:hypothetical protein
MTAFSRLARLSAQLVESLDQLHSLISHVMLRDTKPLTDAGDRLLDGAIAHTSTFRNLGRRRSFSHEQKDLHLRVRQFHGWACGPWEGRTPRERSMLDH